MSYIVQKANRVLTITDEKADEYLKMGYTVKDMSGNVILQPEPTGKEAVNKIHELEAKNKELEEELDAAATHVSDADDKINKLQKENAELQKENAELKAAIKAQSTAGAVVQDSPDSGKKTAAKSTKKSE
jgi:peptidoglycan hydrolase CwlO-like protein